MLELETKRGPKGWEHNWHFVGIPGTGDAVHHPSHGKGIVTAVDDRHVTVKFSGSGAERTFEHSAPKPGKASGFVKRGDHEASKPAAAKPGDDHAARLAERAAAGEANARGMSHMMALAKAGRVHSHESTGYVMPHVADVKAVHGQAEYQEAQSHFGAGRYPEADEALGRAIAAEHTGRDAGAAQRVSQVRDRARAAAAKAKPVSPPLGLMRRETNADGSVTARAVDHQGRDYQVALGADKTVTVTHKGKSLTEPAGANPTQKARELAGKLTAPAPAEARPPADDFWADEQPKAPPAPPAPKPKFDQGAMFSEPDKLGTAPMFGDKFGTADVTKPNADAVAPASAHAATARSLAANVRLENGLSKFQKEEAETRLNSAARHLDAGNHAEAVAELDAAGHATEMRGGGVIKESTAARARDLAAQVRAGHPAAPAARPQLPTTAQAQDQLREVDRGSRYAAALHHAIGGIDNPDYRPVMNLSNTLKRDPEAARDMALHDAMSPDRASAEQRADHVERIISALNGVSHDAPAGQIGAMSSYARNLRAGLRARTAAQASGRDVSAVPDYLHADDLENDMQRVSYANTAPATAAGQTMHAAAQSLRAGRHDDARTLLTHAAGQAEHVTLPGGHPAAPVVQAQIDRLNTAHPAEVMSHAATARNLAATVRDSGLPAAQRTESAGHLEDAARHLDAGDSIAAQYSLNKAADGLRTGFAMSGSESHVIGLRAQGLRDSALADHQARQDAARAADDSDLHHIKYTAPGGGSAHYSVHGTAAAASMRGHARARGGTVTDEAPDTSSMSKGAQGLRDHALANGWDVSYGTSHQSGALNPDNTEGRGALIEDVVASHPDTGEKVQQTWIGGKKTTYAAEPLAKSKEKIAASPRRREAKNAGTAREVKDLVGAITSATGRERAVRNHLAVAEAAIEGGDVKTAYGALDMARRYALGEFGDNPDRPVQLEDKTEAWRPIIRLRDSIRSAV